MFRLCVIRCCSRFTHPHLPFSIASSSIRNINNHTESSNNVKNPPRVPPSQPILRSSTRLLSAPLSSSLSNNHVLALSTALISAIIASYALISTRNNDMSVDGNPIYREFERAVERSNKSVMRVVNQMKQNGVAILVLWKSLRSVLSSANHGVRTGFEIRVASFLADIAAANGGRRAAIVGAGGGAVVDWLLESVSGDGCTAQAESARALAYLIADPNVCDVVLGRPHAVPNLLRFIFTAQPHRLKKNTRRSSFDYSDSLKGRSMLVEAIMDVVTSHCDNSENISFQPSLPRKAEMRDIAAAIEVIEEGGLHLDDQHNSEEGSDDGKELRGIGIKILGGTTVLGFSRTDELVEMGHSNVDNLGPLKYTPTTPLYNPLAHAKLSSVIPGLWDDLHSQHVAVPFAAWALANWAMASEENRLHIQELDQDGHAVMTALMAPERSVKWHGSLVARLLLEDHNLALNDSVSEWSSSLLSTISQASKTEDIALVQMALSAFLLSIERCSQSKKAVMEKGLHQMREIAKLTTKYKPVQEALAKALESLCSFEMHLSLEEGQRWSGILLSWLFEELSPKDLRSSATKTLSHILEDYGPLSLPISQGWLAILITEILKSKSAAIKGSIQPKNDLVKIQIDQSNLVTATQTAHQLAGAVVNMAQAQRGTATDTDETFPLEDLLSLKPFVGLLKNLKKDSLPKLSAADSASATLKGIKAIAEICSVDTFLQNKIVDFGILSLLRRYLLQDDYEQLAAIEAYDTSRVLEAQERVSTASSESSANNIDDRSSLRVPPTAHIRRHAARLLTILSTLPEVQKEIVADETWYNWLEDCASGRVPGCHDLKMQSYARATLLNVLCDDRLGPDLSHDNDSDNVLPKKKNPCPRFTDMIFLINPESPHWKCPENIGTGSNGETPSKSATQSSRGDNDSGKCKGSSLTRVSDDEEISISTYGSESSTVSDYPIMDVVFVHGMRGGPFKTWRLSENKSSTKSGFVEKIDEEAGKQGTFWPGEWLSADFPQARMFSLKYKTNLTQWSGASLPLQEVSSMLLEKLVAAGIGNKPVVFVTHSMGGLVVKQMLHRAKEENKNDLVNNTIGVVFYSCPHFGSKLADMPWRMGLVLRPAPSIGELRSGSPRLVELNDFFRRLHKKGILDVLSFCETKVTPIVEGYGGWAFRLEIVPIESAYPGFGELIVLESTDHVNSCKPLSRTDPSYRETLDFLRKLKAQYI